MSRLILWEISGYKEDGKSPIYALEGCFLQEEWRTEYFHGVEGWEMIGFTILLAIGRDTFEGN